MFPHLSLYLVAAVLLFQGLQLLGPAGVGVVPPEVVPAPVPARRWGLALTAGGSLLVLLGLLGHVQAGWTGSIGLLRNLGVALGGAYGLWLIFGRRVDFLPPPVAAPDPHHH